MFEDRAKSAMDFASEIIDAYGPRLAGSEACGKAAGAIRDRFGTVCDRTAIEDFPVHPGAFLGFIKVLVVAYGAAAAALAFAPIISVVLGTASIFVLVFGFLLYRKVLDPFFPLREGHNVVGVLEPSGEVLRQVIVSGHHDSARIFNFYIDRPELYPRRIYGGIGSVVTLWLVSITVALVSGFALGTSLAGFDLLRGLSSAVFLVLFPFVMPLWYFASDKGTPGAGDNLVASAIATRLSPNSRKGAKPAKVSPIPAWCWRVSTPKRRGCAGRAPLRGAAGRSSPPCPVTATTWTAFMHFLT